MESYGRKKTTITQVAHEAGVSLTTVSLFLSGHIKVCSAKTALRIQKAVADLNYEPNPLAGSIYNRDRRTIGLLAGDDIERGNKPWVVHNMKIVSGIFEVANANNYAVLAYPFRVYLEHQYRAVLDGRVDGILYYGSCNHDFVKLVTKAKMPIVCFGVPEEASDSAGVVHNNEVAISDLVMHHLWDLGHRRIAHLAGPYADCYRYPAGDGAKIPEPAERASWARLVATRNFLEVREAYDPELVSEAHSWQDPDVAPSLNHWWALESRPTAVYCANDYIAWKALEWARDVGIRVPDELAIAGVDNIKGPGQEEFLTSVSLSVEESGHQAMRLMLDMLGGKAEPSAVRTIEPDGLIVRGSTSFRLL